MSASDTVYLYLERHGRPVPTATVLGACRQIRGITADDVRGWLYYLERRCHVRRITVDGRECWECIPEAWAVYTGEAEPTVCVRCGADIRGIEPRDCVCVSCRQDQLRR